MNRFTGSATLEQLACERGEAVDANCDNEPDFACVIVNPPPPMDGDMDGYFGDDDCDDTDAYFFGCRISAWNPRMERNWKH